MRSGRTPRRTAFVGSLIALALACAAESPDESPRLLVVGLDGATNRVIDPLVEAGELPNLAALARSGVRGAVRPNGPILSPRIWTTFVTGVRAERHGVLGWGRPGPEGSVRLFTNLDRTVPAVWNIASAAGRSVGVVNWLMTQPPDRVRGVMISDHAVPGVTAERKELAQSFAENTFGRGGEVVAPEVEFSYTWPLDWAARSQAIRDRQAPPLTDVENPFAGEDGPATAFLSDLFEDDERTVATALEVEARERPDLLMVYLPGIDRVSHLLWTRVDRPQDTLSGLPAVAARNREQLRSYYRFTDALLGRLLARFGEGDTVLVISDHGFEYGSPEMPGVHASEAARCGILYARGPGIEPGSTAPLIAGVDVLPTLLTALDLPSARDLPGHPVPIFEHAPPEPVDSYGDVAMERVGGAASGVEEEILEKLRAVGYVE